jgi:hypothetical protein
VERNVAPQLLLLVGRQATQEDIVLEDGAEVARDRGLCEGRRLILDVAGHEIAGSGREHERCRPEHGREGEREPGYRAHPVPPELPHAIASTHAAHVLDAPLNSIASA